MNTSNIKTRADSAAAEAKETLSDTARQAQENIQQRVKSDADQYKGKAAEEADHIAKAGRAAAEDLKEQGDLVMSKYVSELADQIGEISRSLKEKSVDQLIQDARHFSQKNPALTFLASVAIGLGVARLMKAENPNQSAADNRSSTYGSNTSSSEFDRTAYGSNASSSESDHTTYGSASQSSMTDSSDLRKPSFGTGTNAGSRSQETSSAPFSPSNN